MPTSMDGARSPLVGRGRWTAPMARPMCRTTAVMADGDVGIEIEIETGTGTGTGTGTDTPLSGIRTADAGSASEETAGIAGIRTNCRDVPTATAGAPRTTMITMVGPIQMCTTIMGMAPTAANGVGANASTASAVGGRENETIDATKKSGLGVGTTTVTTMQGRVTDGARVSAGMAETVLAQPPLVNERRRGMPG